MRMPRTVVVAMMMTVMMALVMTVSGRVMGMRVDMVMMVMRHARALAEARRVMLGHVGRGVDQRPSGAIQSSAGGGRT